ncbi:hypothetical protein HNR05_001288 [Leifsonia psychrotolerans]|uniref:Asp23/Gls24 family envelope stress response protein n=1 Tax=Glaciibacter psychrotolerans TaxID=670054 RepID=A0A7Z0ED89_9MICO|nr:hypothetical protein [Leifsonia psychrotolerans]NYJ19497.1 hypothetical protein [Leifsonia psychrotolerans]
MTDRDQPAGSSTLVGRNRITARALRAVAAAAVAETLNVAGRAVSADLADDHGKLAVTVRAAIPVVSLAAIQRNPRALELSGGTLLERCERAQRQTKERVEQLTGRRVSRVDIRVTNARIEGEERVR